MLGACVCVCVCVCVRVRVRGCVRVYVSMPVWMSPWDGLCGSIAVFIISLVVEGRLPNHCKYDMVISVEMAAAVRMVTGQRVSIP